MLLSIENEDDYREALKRFLEICKDPKNDDDIQELYLLLDLMDKYERKSCSQS